MIELVPISPPRVLIVDNEKRAVRLYEQFLNLWGYRPVIAEGAGRRLLEDAKRKARDFRCQIALVDMRLRDDQDEDDTSGLDLIADLKPAETIVVSGHGTMKLLEDSIQNRAADSFFEKDDDPEVLRKKMDRLAGRVCSVRRTLCIEPPEILDLIARTLFDPIKDMPAEARDQAADVLARLFPDAAVLRLEKTSATVVSSDFSTAPRPRSVILLAREDELQPVIVKIARAEKIKKEVRNFEKHIKGRLVGKHNTMMLKDVALWDIGGIRLSYVDALEGLFSNFVAAQPVQQVKNSLERFFLKTWSDHYRRKTDAAKISLFELYCRVWDRDWVERVCKASLPDASEAMSPHWWQAASKSNPIEWLKFIAENEKGENDPSMTELTRLAVTHGDLHADNLLMDDAHECWVVDFERTGEGHVFQDFVELESDIVTRIACAREDFPAFYQFCLAIAGSRSIADPLPALPPSADEEARKLLDIVAHIRRLAAQCADLTDFRQYLFGLYFNTLFRATIAHPERKEKKDLRAWMLASILCRRLACWDDPWPPQEWTIPQ